MRTPPSLLRKLQKSAFAPVDNASLVFFRIVFGSLIIWQVWRYFAKGWIALHWMEPRFLFKYYGFSWVHPWLGNRLYIHWAALGVFACLWRPDFSTAQARRCCSSAGGRATDPLVVSLVVAYPRASAAP
jgi:vitamin K-dependent gamma-carboxylase-like protein